MAVKIDSATGDLTAVAAVTGKKIKVWAACLTLVSGTLVVKSGSTALTGAMTLTQLILPMMPARVPWFETAAGEALVFTTGAQLSGTIEVSIE